MTPQQARAIVRKGRGPKGIHRIDKPKTKGEQWHAHLGPGTGSRNQSGWYLEAQEWIDKGATRILEEGRLEGMTSPAVKAQFDKVLKAEHLENVASAFGDPDFFDEVPLYSRYQQVEFLKRHGSVDALLIGLALDYLDRVRNEVKLPSKRLVALSVSRDDDDYIVPSIFVCNRDIKNRLKELRLSAPSRGLGKQIEALVKKTDRGAAYCVFEDDLTVPDDVRVFIGYKAPARGLEGLEIFANGRRAQRQVG
jgi:hypothetical protein